MIEIHRSEWRRVRFGDVVHNVNDYYEPERDGALPYVAGPHVDEEGAVVGSWGCTSDDDFPPTFKRMFQPGDVLLHSRNINKVAAVDRLGVTGEKLFVLRSREPHVLDQSLLVWLMKSGPMRKIAEDHFTGSVNKFLNWKPLSLAEFELPPLDQQRRIADLMWAVERYLASSRQLKVALQRTRHAYMAARLEQMADRGVEHARIGDLYRVRSGSTPSRGRQADYFDDGAIPWVKTLDLNEGYVTRTEERITERALRDTSCRVYPAGTVLVAMYGGFGQIGRTGLLAVPAATNQALSALTEPDGSLIPEFTQEVLKAKRSDWRRVAASSRKDPNITKSNVEDFLVPVPPHDEQARIVEALKSFDAALDGMQAAERGATGIRAALLNSLWGAQ